MQIYNLIQYKIQNTKNNLIYFEIYDANLSFMTQIKSIVMATNQ